MKRRDFIKSTAVAGMSGFLSQGCSSIGKPSKKSGAGFDVHPFVKNHPEAVFVHLTAVKSKGDSQDIHETSYKLAKELIVKTTTGGYPNAAKIVIKPNWTGAGPQNGKPVYEKLGTNTDPHFIEGWVQGMKEAGPEKYYIRESGSPQFWEPMGYTRIAAGNGIDLRDLSSMDIWELDQEKDLNFVKIPDGVVFREVAYMAPVNEPDTFLVDIAKFKSHSMGLTTSIKNLQGLCGNRFKQFCTRYDQLRETYPERYHRYFRKDFERHIEALYSRHLKEGYPRWDKPGANGGIWMEQWCQRMLDSYSVTPTALAMVEGIYSQDGNGFGSGPHEKLGPYGVTSRDYMSNVVLFGIDPFRVDIIAHWLGGHEPGNFGLFHIGIERGLSDVLDPHDIPVYIWKDGKATITELDSLTRTPLVTLYLQRDYNDQKESRFHLCDEPFDYSAWKSGKKVGDCSPSIRELGRDASNKPVMELTMPKRADVYVDVMNSKGEVLWRLVADDLEPGVHQVVWDGFASPGLHNFYVKGMGWDTKKQIVTYA